MGNLKDTLYLSANRIMYRRMYFAGIAAYVVMLLFSVLFYKERVIFVDTSFAIFHFIKDHVFRIEFFRFGDLFSQILPICAVKAGASLNYIMLSYSVSFIIYYFLCYFICGSVLKQYDLALAILLLNTLFVADTFFWIPSEVPQGMALLMTGFALLRNDKIKTTPLLMWGLFLVVIITVAFFHALMVFALFYSVGFFLLKKDIFPARKMLFAVAALYIAIVLLKAVFFRTQYEQHAMGGLRNFLTLFPDYCTYSFRRFFDNCLTKYYWIPVASCIVVIHYAAARQWMPLWLFLVSTTGYLLLVNVTFPTAATPAFYIENLCLPISVFIALPWVFDVLPFLQRKKLAMPIMTLILFTACLRIYNMHAVYARRLDHERRFLDKYGGTKVVVKARRTDLDTLQIAWCTPYELLLLSQSERGRPASIIIDEDPARIGWAWKINAGLVVNWDIFPYKDIPARYFPFTDTVTGYTIDPDKQ